MNIEAILNGLIGQDVLIEECGTITHSDIVIYKFDWKYYGNEESHIAFKSNVKECEYIDYITFDSRAVKEVKETSYNVYEIEFNNGQGIILTGI